jgi:DNA segregation ATPase FtsK/SpoIIIE-like protein
MENDDFIEKSLEIIDYIHETMKSRELKISQGEKFTDNDNLVLVIDEVADLIEISSSDSNSTKKTKEKIIKLLNNIARKGRSSRVFMLLATQYAKVSVLGHLKSNMELLALRVLTEGDEKSIGLPCKDLLGSGDGRMAYDGSLIRFQSCF